MTKTKKKVIISMISIIILCLVLVISKSYSLTKKHSNNILKEKGNYISFTIDGVASNDAFPSKRTGYIANSVSCTNGTTATWDNEKWGLVNIVSNNKNKINCNVDFHYDGVSPTLSLIKETYLEDDFTGWTLTNARVFDDNGTKVLALGEDGNDGDAVSPTYYHVNGGFWYITFDGYSTNTTQQWVRWKTNYYDDNMNEAYTLNGSKDNGWATTVNYNEWKNNVYWQGNYNSITSPSVVTYKRYGPDVKYTSLLFVSTKNESYSRPPVFIRNLKICGEAIPNSFYDIKITSSDNEGVTETKYASGSQTAEYFRNNGTVVTDSSIRVTTNGTYTVYVRDAVGNETIDTIEITNIV